MANYVEDGELETLFIYGISNGAVVKHPSEFPYTLRIDGEDVEPETGTVIETPTETVEDDSGVRFSGLNGQVEVLFPGETEWDFAESTNPGVTIIFSASMTSVSGPMVSSMLPIFAIRVPLMAMFTPFLMRPVATSRKSPSTTTLSALSLPSATSTSKCLSFMSLDSILRDNIVGCIKDQSRHAGLFVVLIIGFIILVYVIRFYSR